MRAALFAAAVCSVASMRLVNEASPDVSPQSGGGDDGENEEDDHVRARQVGLVNRFRWQLAIPENLADRVLEPARAFSIASRVVGQAVVPCGWSGGCTSCCTCS